MTIYQSSVLPNAAVVKACPTSVQLVLRIDSMATIGAITKGTVSERRRVRAAGRAWMNLCRNDFIEKQEKIRIEHISSHKGSVTPEQVGNDMFSEKTRGFSTCSLSIRKRGTAPLSTQGYCGPKRPS